VPTMIECSSVVQISLFFKVISNPVLCSQPEVLKQVHSPAYGLTETSPAILVVPPSWHDRKYGSVGALLSSQEIRLIAEDGSDAPRNEPGEIWVRGANVMKV
jgi:long-chain acyl-CoA synthetase